jgi:hypothetical protein
MSCTFCSLPVWGQDGNEPSPHRYAALHGHRCRGRQEGPPAVSHGYPGAGPGLPVGRDEGPWLLQIKDPARAAWFRGRLICAENQREGRPGGAMSCPAASCLTATMPCWDRADRPVPVTRGCALTPRLSWACLLLASPAMAGQRASGASQPGSWTAGWKAATPTHLSSSAASAVTIPTWTTTRSPAGCSASAGHTLLTRALQRMRTTSVTTKRADRTGTSCGVDYWIWPGPGGLVG